MQSVRIHSKNAAFQRCGDRVGFGRGLAMVVAASCLGACSSTPVIVPDGTLVRRYLGYVKVAIPQAVAPGPVYVSDVTVVGLRIANGIGVGYSRDRQVVVPIDCRLVLLVATQAQLNAAVELMPAALASANTCAAVTPSLAEGGTQ